MKWLQTRGIRPPPDDITPNPNDPAEVPPATVGPNVARPGDPRGVIITGQDPPPAALPRIAPSAWSGWPAEWWPPAWGGHVAALSDTAWVCVDLNASVLATMPPYLVGAPPSIDAGWLANPNPETYASWEEFCKSLFWDFQLGEVFVLATARYASGWPARFHVVPGWAVDVELEDGRRRYRIGGGDVTADILHLRYAGSVDDARGHGPLEAGRASLVAEQLLRRYATGFAAAGGIPPSVLEHPDELTATQSAALKEQWILARMSGLGEPAVLSGGVTWKATGVNPKESAAAELLAMSSSQIAVLLGVPPFLVGLPSGGDSMTYSNTSMIFDYHWRASLRPKAQTVMAGISQWLLPRGTSVELNRDAYVQPDPYTRAQTAEILLRAGVVSVDEIRDAERLTLGQVAGLSAGKAG